MKRIEAWFPDGKKQYFNNEVDGFVELRTGDGFVQMVWANGRTKTIYCQNMIVENDGKFDRSYYTDGPGVVTNEEDEADVEDFEEETAPYDPSDDPDDSSY
ncbi:hypothetical protein [Schleiferilactobacillus perolens]|jgi:hypothetical protein|uniref:hypothetical protein n=1 Tax=Schleiferilactobacillus perolens TaxID=100468 RepID=UPI0023538494|nr:hypothetical protein [Schleiferilactobacillus perolens]MCI2170984.1 hypothetical protein [Schleiferilactobacillus perolens]